LTWKKSLPMWITWSRMVLCIPIAVVVLTMDSPLAGYVAAALFILASLTDWADGYFARRFDAQSTMGKFMDPIADKILVSTILILMIPLGVLGRDGPILVILLLSRDILIGGIRSIAAADRLIIDAKATGKWKTAVQMVAIPCILIGPIGPVPLAEIGRIALWVSTILSFISGWQYVSMYLNSRKGA
jgi:CDP-diacylglycerol--glycerol-3-phosphate 3-phosphatidyltransferase